MKIEDLPNDLTWDMVWAECQKQTVELIADMIAKRIANLENCPEDHVAENELCILMRDIQNFFKRRKNEVIS